MYYTRKPREQADIHRQRQHLAQLRGRGEEQSKAAAATTATIVGTFALGMLIVVPIWNALLMRDDPTYVYLQGERLPNIIIISCASVVYLYLMCVPVLYCCAPRELHTEQSVLLVSMVFVITLAAIFLGIGNFSDFESLESDIWRDCSSGPMTHKLFEQSQVLQGLRADPKCANQTSVELCEGYVATPEAAVLKAMEDRMHCAGFCFDPTVTRLGITAEMQKVAMNVTGSKNDSALMAAMNATDDADALAFLQVGSQRGSMARRLIAQEAKSAWVPERGRGIYQPYPPTLFSAANFQASCDGMTARSFKDYKDLVQDTATTQGFTLGFACVLVAFLKLISTCTESMAHSELILRDAAMQQERQRYLQQGFGGSVLSMGG